MVKTEDLNFTSRRPIEIDVPDEFSQLPELAYNLWWSWSPKAMRMFSFLGPDRWTHYRNPVELLMEMDPPHWYPLQNNEQFLSLYSEVVREFENYMNNSGNGDSYDYPGPVAYFSTEYGIHDCIPIFSGGLGVLSGEHVKSASDRDLPLVAIGLLYRNGYFEQCVDADGSQHHVLPRIDFTRLPVQEVLNDQGHPLVINCPLKDETVNLRVWKVQVGKIPIILLDSDFPENPPELRPVTGQLYVRKREMRLCQEIVLGVGGVKALRALDIDPAVWHMNEGHSVFQVTERLQSEVSGSQDLDSALKQISSSTLFTTHTPVVAGHERYDVDLIEEYFEDFCEKTDLNLEDFVALGRSESDSSTEFNLTAFAIRSAERTNGVSKLHERVTGEMWGGLLDSEKLFSITNGVHAPTWLGTNFRDLLRVPPSPWSQSDLEKIIARLESLSDQEIWEAHCFQKERFLRIARQNLHEQKSRHGESPPELAKIDRLFDTDTLQIGFARRFATYKRADLIFRDYERLKALLTDSSRPVQIIFAGKAHPADKPGQQLIRDIFAHQSREELSNSIIFLENYNLGLATRLVQGVDVWLNTPRRPNEASGTSGMKAAFNGVLNLSIIDGWWAEGYNGENGWTIGDEKERPPEEGDHVDAVSLYETLENEVVPDYYERNESGLPSAWISRMREAIKSTLGFFNTNRMVGEYEESAYRPLAEK